MAGNNQLGGKPIEHAPVGDKAVQAPLEGHPQLQRDANLATPDSNAHIASMKGDTGSQALLNDKFGIPTIGGMDGKDLVAGQAPSDLVTQQASSRVTKELNPISTVGNSTKGVYTAEGDNASLVTNAQADNVQV